VKSRLIVGILLICSVSCLALSDTAFKSASVLADSADAKAYEAIGRAMFKVALVVFIGWILVKVISWWRNRNAERPPSLLGEEGEDDRP
jgi:hypothetical protein